MTDFTPFALHPPVHFDFRSEQKPTQVFLPIWKKFGLRSARRYRQVHFLDDVGV